MLLNLGGGVQERVGFYIKNNLSYKIGIISGTERYNTNRISKEVDLQDYYNYSWGDYITHLDYGVGIYRGLVTKQNKDYIKLEYAKNATVYISAQRVDLISPLVGVQKPKINNIGTKAWATNKNNTKKRIRTIIEEMVQINKNRSSRREIPYKKEDYLERELADSFPYVETKDQAGAINDIYNHNRNNIISISNLINCWQINNNNALLDSVSNSNTISIIGTDYQLLEHNFC